jgi:hypothetical protein
MLIAGIGTAVVRGESRSHGFTSRRPTVQSDRSQAGFVAISRRCRVDRLLQFGFMKASSFINDRLAMSSGQKDWKNRALRLSRLTADSVMCQTCNCPFPAVVLITDQKTKAVQALCKVHVRAMSGRDTDLIDSE